MSEDHCVSRRTSLKSLGAVGAAIVLGAPAAAQAPVEPKTVKSEQTSQAGNPVDVAADRFAKGHS